MTNVRRVREPDTDAQDRRQADELLRGLDREERAEKRRAQRRHAAAYRRWDEATRDLKSRCGYCGRPAVEGAGTRVMGREWVSDDALGHINVGRCRICLALYRSQALGQIPLNVDRLVITAALTKAALEKYSPGRDLWTRKLSGLSWASFAYRARVAGADDPGDPEVAFSHLQGLRPEGIDWSPVMTEPVMARRL